MSLLNLVVIIIAFAVLFKYVVPFLFPAVVKGEYVVNPRELLRNKKRDDQGEDDAAGLDENFVVRGGGVSFVPGHRTQMKGEIRRRNAESKANMS